MHRIKLIALVFIVYLVLSANTNIKIEEESFTMLKAENSPVYITPITYMSMSDYENYSSTAVIENMADNIIECESNGRMVYGDNGMAYGIAQFWLDTFNMMKTQSGMYWLNYYCADDQRSLLLWALENGLGNHWTCFRTLGYNNK